jgi:hypothetical protein
VCSAQAVEELSRKEQEGSDGQQLSELEIKQHVQMRLFGKTLTAPMRLRLTADHTTRQVHVTCGVFGGCKHGYRTASKRLQPTRPFCKRTGGLRALPCRLPHMCARPAALALVQAVASGQPLPVLPTCLQLKFTMLEGNGLMRRVEGMYAVLPLDDAQAQQDLLAVAVSLVTGGPQPAAALGDSGSKCCAASSSNSRRSKQQAAQGEIPLPPP